MINNFNSICNLGVPLPSTHTFQGLRLGHPWRAIILPTTGLPGSSVGKESACNARDLGSILGLGRFPGEGKGYLLQYSVLENSMDYTVTGVTKNQT